MYLVALVALVDLLSIEAALVVALVVVAGYAGAQTGDAVRVVPRRVSVRSGCVMWTRWGGADHRQSGTKKHHNTERNLPGGTNGGGE